MTRRRRREKKGGKEDDEERKKGRKKERKKAEAPVDTQCAAIASLPPKQVPLDNTARNFLVIEKGENSSVCTAERRKHETWGRENRITIRGWNEEEERRICIQEGEKRKKKNKKNKKKKKKKERKKERKKKKKKKKEEEEEEEERRKKKKERKKEEEERRKKKEERRKKKKSVERTLRGRPYRAPAVVHERLVPLQQRAHSGYASQVAERRVGRQCLQQLTVPLKKTHTQTHIHTRIPHTVCERLCSKLLRCAQCEV